MNQQWAEDERANRAIVRISETPFGREWLERITIEDPGDTNSPALNRLSAICELSSALADHLASHPQDLLALEEPTSFDRSFSPDELRDLFVTAGKTGGRSALVLAYRRALLGIAARDLAHGWPVEAVAAELSDVADAILASGLALNKSSSEQTHRLAVIAMGKAGGHELNYVSDVDVIFVYEGDEVAATKAASDLVRFVSSDTDGGAIWQIDAALRPEGKAGPLVRSLEQFRNYYQSHAQTWEFQALLKGRPAAGDRELGQAFLDTVTPLIWHAADRKDFVADVQRMRRKVEENIPAKDAERQLKLGRGGLRDVEFAVQLLQLVHGRSDLTLRNANTLTALQALATWGYVGREDAASLAHAYRFLRKLEHRMQLQRLSREQVISNDPSELRRLGRSMGFTRAPAEELEESWRKEALQVRRIHEKLFYRPLLGAVARIPGEQARLTPEAATQRLHALGYADPGSALRHLTALSGGVSRRAAIQKTLLPVMLGWFAETPRPDNGLLAFRRVSDALGSTPWYLRLLRDESLSAERLAHLLAASPYVSEMLLRAPDSVALLADGDALTPRSGEALAAEVQAMVDRHESPEKMVEALRAFRRRELLRIASADVLGLIGADQVARGLSDAAEAILQGALQAAIESVLAAADLADLPFRFAVLGMGRLGGGEMGFASDADVMYVFDPKPGTDEQAAADIAVAIAEKLRALLASPGPDPSLTVDADLRPEGKNGPLVRSLSSYAAYYERWSAVWESQALLRARAVAGDISLAGELIELIDPIRYPKVGLSENDLREIRRIKARVEAERLPRGADPALNAKLGRGGLADVEWLVQTIQLGHSHEFPSLQTTSTTEALSAAAEAGLLPKTEADVLASAWHLASRVRNANTLALGRPSDQLPTDVSELAAVAYVVGYPLGEHHQLLEDYRRVTRRARAVFEDLFFGAT